MYDRFILRPENFSDPEAPPPVDTTGQGPELKGAKGQAGSRRGSTGKTGENRGKNSRKLGKHGDSTYRNGGLTGKKWGLNQQKWGLNQEEWGLNQEEWGLNWQELGIELHQTLGIHQGNYGEWTLRTLGDTKFYVRHGYAGGCKRDTMGYISRNTMDPACPKKGNLLPSYGSFNRDNDH